MASTYSTNLALELIGTGDQAGTWGATTNTNLGTLIEQAVSGYVTQAITDGADTVITIPNGVTGVARNMYLELTGALTAARNLLVPSNKKLYFIYNNTSGGYAVTVKVSGQTGVSVPNGKKMVLVSNGTDVVEAVNYSSVQAAAGSNTQMQYNNSGVLGGSTLTYNNSTGGFSISAPSSGSTLSLAGLTGTTALTVTNSTSGSGSEYQQSWSNGTDANLFVRVSQVGASTKFSSIESSTATDLRFGTNSSTRVTVGSAGNVTISAPSSGTALSVTGILSGVAQSWSNSGGTASLTAFLDNSIATFGTPSTTPFGIATNGSTRVTFNSTGNVTINAPTSGTALTVAGLTGQNVLAARILGSTNNPGLFVTPTEATGQVDLNISGSAGSPFATISTGGVERVRIANAGNVTINAPTSGHTLSLTAASGGYGLVINQDSTTPGIYCSNGAGSFTLQTGGAVTQFFTNNSGWGLELGTGNTARLAFSGSTAAATFSVSAATTTSAVTFSATAMTVDCSKSNVFTTTFTANVTTAPTFSSPSDGQTVNWFITQDATGSRTMTWPTSFKWPGGTAGTLSTAANAIDLLVVTYRAATGHWYASLSKGFA